VLLDLTLHVPLLEEYAVVVDRGSDGDDERDVGFADAALLGSDLGMGG
jgi:hypothetical protein